MCGKLIATVSLREILIFVFWNGFYVSFTLARWVARQILTVCANFYFFLSHWGPQTIGSSQHSAERGFIYTEVKEGCLQEVDAIWGKLELAKWRWEGGSGLGQRPKRETVASWRRWINNAPRGFPGDPGLGLHASSAGDTGLAPGRRSSTGHMVQPKHTHTPYT